VGPVEPGEKRKKREKGKDLALIIIREAPSYQRKWDRFYAGKKKKSREEEGEGGDPPSSGKKKRGPGRTSEKRREGRGVPDGA